ncbi:MAG: hypothetical protein ACREME_00100 [Gemmatimonadales bacterium]
MNPRYLLAAAVVAAICACGSQAERPSAETARETASTGQPSAERPSAAPVSTAVAAAAVPAACDLIPRTEIERIAGPLQNEPKLEGNGCWYHVAMDTTSAEWKQLGAGAERARAAGMDARAIELYHPTRAGLHVEVDVRGDGRASNQAATAPEGWDEAGASRSGAVFNGRAGYVRVAVRLQQLRIPPDTVVAIASRVRDRIPDGPIPHPAADHSPQAAAGHDPCSVLTREEAGAVLGNLVAAPFRTREGTPLADPSGKSCAYLTPGHRVLVLTPVWEYGRLALDAERMVGGMVRQVADLPGVEGDTLEGPWDDAVVGLSGELLLLKGAHALGMRYEMSSTNAAGAIRLAGPALRRLAATPEPTRPSIAAHGCLPEATVGEVVGSPARLVFNAMSAAGMCNYTLRSDPTVSIELAVQPAQRADDIFAQLQQRVRLARGESAEAERISVGDGGWAYGAGSQSEAAARRRGKVYRARMSYPLSTTSPDRKDAMVQLVTRMME